MDGGGDGEGGVEAEEHQIVGKPRPLRRDVIGGVEIGVNVNLGGGGVLETPPNIGGGEAV